MLPILSKAGRFKQSLFVPRCEGKMQRLQDTVKHQARSHEHPAAGPGICHGRRVRRSGLQVSRL